MRLQNAQVLAITSLEAPPPPKIATTPELNPPLLPPPLLEEPLLQPVPPSSPACA